MVKENLAKCWCRRLMVRCFTLLGLQRRFECEFVKNFRRFFYLLSASNPCQQATGSLVQAGVLSRVTLCRILKVHLPSEPYRYPRLPQAAKTLAASEGQRVWFFRWTLTL